MKWVKDLVSREASLTNFFWRLFVCLEFISLVKSGYIEQVNYIANK